jgi:hypothetical protein
MLPPKVRKSEIQASFKDIAVDEQLLAGSARSFTRLPMPVGLDFFFQYRLRVSMPIATTSISSKLEYTVTGLGAPGGGSSGGGD